jgi:ribosomal-protein-alanine N-acetyltransferase
MRFWNQPLFTRLIESERQVRNYTECTPAYYRYWAIADATTDKCLGLASYHDGHIRSKRASIGYMIHPAHHRKGLATEAVSALLDHCFGELRLHRLEAFIHPDNTASRALVEKRGFQPEGLLRDHARVGETWRDQLIYARLTPHLDTQP